MQKKIKKKNLSLYANPDEMSRFKLIKTIHHRKSDSDMIRQLIIQESEKFLPKDVPIGTGRAAQ